MDNVDPDLVNLLDTQADQTDVTNVHLRSTQEDAGCWNRMSWIGSASFPAKVSGANGLLDSWGSPATPSAVISLEPRSLSRTSCGAALDGPTLRNVPETTSLFSRNMLSSPPLGAKQGGGQHGRLCTGNRTEDEAAL